MACQLFGTDGIRGVANVFPMTAELCFRLAQVLSSDVCVSAKRVAIGKDTRVSSYMLEAALTAGFTSMGVDVVKMGVVPTPLMTSQIQDLKVDMGVMITASHNSYFDNGIKLIGALGNKFSDERTAKIEAMLISDRKFTSSSEAVGRVYKDKKSVLNYTDGILQIAPSGGALKGLRIVVDCANGAFSKIMPQVFKELGAGIITLADKPDGYNINENCGSQHTDFLSQVVIGSHADAGIAVDGDGDRLVVIDNKGNRIEGDQIIAFLATYLSIAKKLKNNAVVATVWSNMGLEKYLHSLGLDFYRTPVGERYVIEKMRQTAASFGGEESGHIVLLDYARTGDGLIAAIVFCLALIEDGREASDIFPLFEKYPSKAGNIRFESFEKLSDVADAPQLAEVVALIEEKIKNEGSVIVRKSGTEPVLKVKVEGRDESTVFGAYARIVETINRLK